MASIWAKPFYNSTAWTKCRQGYIASVHGLCERCGEVGYIVHHKEYIRQGNIDNPDVTLNWDNLEYLCKVCHDKEHGVGAAGEVIRQGLAFDENGNVIQSPLSIDI